MSDQVKQDGKDGLLALRDSLNDIAKNDISKAGEAKEANALINEMLVFLSNVGQQVITIDALNFATNALKLVFIEKSMRKINPEVNFPTGGYVGGAENEEYPDKPTLEWRVRSEGYTGSACTGLDEVKSYRANGYECGYTIRETIGGQYYILLTFGDKYGNLISGKEEYFNSHKQAMQVCEDDNKARIAKSQNP